MVKGKLSRILAIPLVLVMATTLMVTSACTPEEVKLLEGLLENVDSANGKITIVTDDGKTVTVKIDTETKVETQDAASDVTSLKPGTSVEVEVKEREQTVRRIKTRETEESSTSKRVGWGILEIRVTDPGPADVESAVVYLSNIQVHRASDNASVSANDSGAWLPITTNITSFDLMDVIGVEKFLASANLTAGKYTQIRMTVTKVEGETTDNVSYTAEVPSNELKIVGVFYVGDGDKTVLTLDFDGQKSLIRTGSGKFLFKPVVKLLVDKEGKALQEREREREKEKDKEQQQNRNR